MCKERGPVWLLGIQEGLEPLSSSLVTVSWFSGADPPLPHSQLRWDSVNQDEAFLGITPPHRSDGFRKTRGPWKLKETFAGASGEEPSTVSVGATASVLPPLETWDRSQHEEGQGWGTERSQVLIVSFEILKPEASEARPTYRLRPSYIICRVWCKIKIRAPCSKSRSKVSLKKLKYKAFFSLPGSLCQLFVVFFKNLLLSVILSQEKLKL